MNINEIIFILENKIKNLEQQRSMAVTNGDIDIVTNIDAQLMETKATIEVLKKVN